MTNSLLFIGDVGIDHYLQHNTFYPGGCSLNSALHCWNYNPNINIQLCFPSSSHPLFISLRKLLSLTSITPYQLQGHGPPPTQEIDISLSGEKIFRKYHSNILEEKINFDKLPLHTFSIVPCYLQITKFCLNHLSLSGNSSFIDFLSMEDFDKRFDNIQKYIDKSAGAFFGLHEEDDHLLIEDIKNYSIKTKKPMIITLGEKGAIAFMGEEQHQQDSFHAQKVIDTTGAGDSFIAIFMANYLEGKPIEKCLHEACQYSSKTIQHLGAPPEKLINLWTNFLE